MTGDDPIQRAVTTLTAQVGDAYKANQKEVTVEALMLMTLLAGFASLERAQRERDRATGGAT